MAQIIYRQLVYRDTSCYNAYGARYWFSWDCWVNRLKGCVLSNDKVMREKGRGSTEMKSCKINGSESRVIRWFDNRSTTILTKYEAVQPSTNVKRWDRKNKVEIQVSCPSAVVTYNKSMGGVDLLDGLLSYYRISVKSKKMVSSTHMAFL